MGDIQLGLSNCELTPASELLHGDGESIDGFPGSRVLPRDLSWQARQRNGGW